MNIKRYTAMATSAMLTIASMISLPVKFNHQHQHSQEICVDDFKNDRPWNKARSKLYALTYITHYFPSWGRNEYRALVKLWGKESAWNHEADNPKSSAYGIAQVLKTKPGTPAPLQIERGLEYIVHRYDKPSIAWSHWRKYGWY